MLPYEKDFLALLHLQVSHSKTKFLCSDAATSKALRGLREDSDPSITDLAKDLAIDSNAGRRRRLATFLSRLKKASSRNGQLRKLRVPGCKARARLVRTSPRE